LNIRKIIADRLQYELNRRDISLADVSKKTKISKKKLEKYIEGNTEITITDIVSVCELVGINAVRLLYSKKYPKPKLSFRNAGFDMQYSASQIEDAFLTIRDAFPKIDPTVIEGFQRKVKDTGFDAVMFAAADCAENVRKQFPTPEDFIIKNNIPVFPINERQDGFDGFLISTDQHQAICVNTNKPPHRIRFTLCHEISHLLYDQNKDIPIDVFIPNLYRDTYSPEEFQNFLHISLLNSTYYHSTP
jgi:transcriptional regulator with XRE-family HTH domain